MAPQKHPKMCGTKRAGKWTCNMRRMYILPHITNVSWYIIVLMHDLLGIKTQACGCDMMCFHPFKQLHSSVFWWNCLLRYWCLVKWVQMLFLKRPKVPIAVSGRVFSGDLFFLRNPSTYAFHAWEFCIFCNHFQTFRKKQTLHRFDHSNAIWCCNQWQAFSAAQLWMRQRGMSPPSSTKDNSFFGHISKVHSCSTVAFA